VKLVSHFKSLKLLFMFTKRKIILVKRSHLFENAFHHCIFKHTTVVAQDTNSIPFNFNITVFFFHSSWMLQMCSFLLHPGLFTLMAC